MPHLQEALSLPAVLDEHMVTFSRGRVLIVNLFMKNFITVVFIIHLLFLGSCEPAATFDKPQPDNEKSLTAFPKQLHGKYIDFDQASIVTITDKLITRQFDFNHKEYKDSLGSNYKITGDTLINLTDGTKEKILLKGDTVVLHANWIDTLFNISPDNIIKKFKGYYFLNNRCSDSAWEVNQLSLQKGTLTVGSVSEKGDVNKLKEITETTADTTSTHFTLTRRQFKKFVRQAGFREQENFKRMQ